LIKSAQSYHIKDIVRITQNYFNLSPYVRTQQYDADKFLHNIRKRIISPTSEVAVAEWDNKTVGFTLSYLGEFMWAQATCVKMELIYVESDYRQYGLTQGLLDHNIAWARSMNATEFLAGDIGINTEVITRFYQMQGFEDPGVIVRRVL